MKRLLSLVALGLVGLTASAPTAIRDAPAFDRTAEAATGRAGVSVGSAVVGERGSAEPSGRLVFSGDLEGERYVFVANDDGSGLTRLVRGSGPVWAPDGASIAFTRDGRLFLMAADGSALRKLWERPGMQWSSPVWSPDGSKLVLSGGDAAAENSVLYLVSVADGSARELASGRSSYHATWSPDSTQVAYANGAEKIAVLDVLEDERREITVPGARDPAWSPSGDRIAFAHDNTIYTIGVDGLGLIPVASSPAWYGVETPVWSPDGRRFAFTVDNGEADGLVVVDIDTGDVHRIGPGENGEYWLRPAWSPDGQWLAYLRERYVGTRVFDVWIASPDGTDTRSATRAFPDGISYGSFEHGPSWSRGTVPESVASGPRTVETAAHRTLGLHGAAGDVAADGLRLVTVDPNWGCAATLWDERTGWRRTKHPPDAGYSLPQEPALADATAAWACAEWDNTFHGLALYAWDSAAGSSRRVAATGYRTHSLNLHGDGSLLVFNTGSGTHAKLWRIVEVRRRLLLQGPASGPVVDVNRGRIAIRRGARVDLRGADGRLLSRVAIGKGGSVALSGSNLVLLREQTLEVYDVDSGHRVRSWPLDPGGYTRPRLLDAEGDFAVYVAGIAIHLVRLSDGKDLALGIDGQADTGGADLEPEGLFYSYNRAYTDPPGRMAFVATEDLRQGFDAAQLRGTWP